MKSTLSTPAGYDSSFLWSPTVILSKSHHVPELFIYRVCPYRCVFAPHRGSSESLLTELRGSPRQVQHCTTWECLTSESDPIYSNGVNTRSSSNTSSTRIGHGNEWPKHSRGRCLSGSCGAHSFRWFTKSLSYNARVLAVFITAKS